VKGGRGLVRAEVNEDPFGWVCLQKHTSFKPYDITAKPPDWLTEKGEEMPEIDTMAHFVLMSPRDIGAASRSRCLDPAWWRKSQRKAYSWHEPRPSQGSCVYFTEAYCMCNTYAASQIHTNGCYSN